MRRLWTPTLLLLLISTGHAQLVPPAPKPVPKNPSPGYLAHLAGGKRAIESKDWAAAVERLLLALRHHPYDAAVLTELLRASQTDPQARILWAHALASVSSSKGRLRLKSAIRRLLPSGDRHISRLLRSRAEAVRQLSALARKDRKPSDRLRARWAAIVARELCTPELLGKYQKGLVEATKPALVDHRAIVKALEKLLARAESKQELGRALRIARCLRGLGAQARLKSLKGPRPKDAETLGKAGGAAMARLRKLIAAANPPEELAKLEKLTPEQKESFNLRHATFLDPGVCNSPKGLYRVETTCGVDTLVGVAKTIERHHRRLVRWYAKDPFAGRPGLVRVVPEAEDMEAEGTPFWWAGGFQSGDTTVVRFNCGTIEGLGHAITHELTHRFDGAIYPGLPAWLAEGRAVWTAAAYGNSRSARFAPGHARIGTIEAAFIKGYNSAHKVIKLIDGKIADYRDNYTAGYALFVYLDSWDVTTGKKLFASRLGPYMESFAKGSREAPGARFARFFADGKEGRPKDLNGFAQGFGKFVRAFYWRGRAKWTAKYAVRLKGGGSPLVLDHRTWTWSRTNAEPVFGQGHARTAGRLLLEGGKEKLAAAAWCWAMETDEWTAEQARELAELLERTGDEDGAWVVRALARHRFPSAALEGPAPFRSSISQLHSHLKNLADAVTGYREKQRPLVAAYFAADHDRLARLAGVPALGLAPPSREALKGLRHPFNPPAAHLGAHGWVETGLSGYEERRARNCWYSEPGADLHVGRREPRKGTGTISRGAAWRDAFTRSRQWLAPGRYLLRMRVHPTTSYVSGAVIVGWARRDRNVRIRFSCGDWGYAVGASKKKHALRNVSVNIRGLRIRDGSLSGSTRGRTVSFKHPVASFRVSILVDRGQLQVYVEEQFVGSYHMPDARPLEGFVGFASSMGAYRVQEPTLQRLDRHPDLQLARDWPRPLDIARETKQDPERQVNLLTRGIPRAPSGTLVLWIHRREDARTTVKEARAWALTLRNALAGRAQRLVLAVPSGLAAQSGQAGVTVVEHRWSGAGPDRLLFVDRGGILRVVLNMSAYAHENGTLERWLRIFHDQQRIGDRIGAVGQSEAVEEPRKE